MTSKAKPTSVAATASSAPAWTALPPPVVASPVKITSFPHPCFPGVPTVEEVIKAKNILVSKICGSKAFLGAIRDISIDPKGSYRAMLLKADRTSTDLITKKISIYSMINHETVWPEILDHLHRSLGIMGNSGANILVQREQDYVSIRLAWN